MRKKNLIEYYKQYYIEDIHYFFVNLKKQCSVDSLWTYATYARSMQGWDSPYFISEGITISHIHSLMQEQNDVISWLKMKKKPIGQLLKKGWLELGMAFNSRI